MIKIEEKKLTFSKSLKVAYSGKLISETDETITIEGQDEESYLKIYNPFRGVAKLMLFENNLWADIDGSADNPMGNMDLSSLGMDPESLKQMMAGVDAADGDAPEGSLGDLPEDHTPPPIDSKDVIEDAEIVEPEKSK